jgi:CheY-like chemotaxis protein
MRVLYIDDDRVNALLFTETCRLVDGVVVETAGSGAEALELLDGFDPELLVIDLHLPDTDGYALLGALRARSGGRTPAVLCSAEDPRQVEGPARAAGFDHCWPKPVELAMVLAELRRLGSPGGPP